MDTPQYWYLAVLTQLCLEKQVGITAPGEVFAKPTKTNSI
jgi:hypothetical protein